MIAQVAVSCAVYAIDQPYSYRVPENMALLPGMRVVVPFGRANRRTEAIVLTITTGSEENGVQLSSCARYCGRICAAS